MKIVILRKDKFVNLYLVNINEKQIKRFVIKKIQNKENIYNIVNNEKSQCDRAKHEERSLKIIPKFYIKWLDLDHLLL